MKDLYRLADLPLREIPRSNIPYARGHLDSLVPLSANAVQVTGWMAVPGAPLDNVEVYLNAQQVLSTPIRLRPDVQAFYPWLPHGESTGFDFTLPLTDRQARTTSRLDLVAGYRGTPQARLSQLVRTDLDAFPSPPEDYIYRVAHMRQAHNFKVAGLKSLGDYLEVLARHADVSSFRRMLDWGCGCGRMSAFFLAAGDCAEFAGCDIDAQAIAWSNENLRSGAFSVIPPMPPTHYPDNHFDLIISYSVFTHLARDVQHAWLAEIRRILAPGGIFLASVHGQLAYDFGSGALGSAFPKAGIVDSFQDPTLGTIAPPGYYRATYQSEAYTRREFGAYFRILEYVERAAIIQDLVVMKKEK